MDSQTLQILQTIEGSETKREVGKQLRIQEDSDRLQRGYRIWYSTTDKIIAASYTFYDTEVLFEDEVVFYSVLSVDSTIGKFMDNFLFTSIRDESFLDLYSLTACTSGDEYSFDELTSGVKSNIGCKKCGTDLFSTGFTSCQTCEFWESFSTENSYKLKVIDETCK